MQLVFCLPHLDRFLLLFAFLVVLAEPAAWRRRSGTLSNTHGTVTGRVLRLKRAQLDFLAARARRHRSGVVAAPTTSRQGCLGGWEAGIVPRVESVCVC